MREPTQPLQIINGRARVLDGDTIEVSSVARLVACAASLPDCRDACNTLKHSHPPPDVCTPPSFPHPPLHEGR